VQELPLILEAVRDYVATNRKADGFLWIIANHLVAVSPDKLGQVEKFLAVHGFADFSRIYLRQIRRTALAAGPDARASGIAFGVWSRLLDAQTVEEARQEAESEGKALTVRYAEKFLRERRRKQAERQRRANDKLKDGPKPDVAYEKALADFVRSLGQGEGACDYAADLFARHLSKQISDLERADLISGARSLARRWDNMAETMESKSPLAEAAE
jgi:hypothetical protein